MPEEFGTIKATTQLEMQLFADQVKAAEEGRGGKPLSAREIKEREAGARAALQDKLEGDEVPSWAESFNRLLYADIPWRIAAFVAWASTPKRGRWPATQDELAQQVLGLNSDRQIAEWRKKYPIINMMIANLQADELLEARGDVFWALKEMAKQIDYKANADRKLYLEMTGDYVSTTKLAAELRKRGISADDLDGLSNEELLEIAHAAKEKAGAPATHVAGEEMES